MTRKKSTMLSTSVNLKLPEPKNVEPDNINGQLNS